MDVETGGRGTLRPLMDPPPTLEPPTVIDISVEKVNELTKPSSFSPSKGKNEEEVTVDEPQC